MSAYRIVLVLRGPGGTVDAPATKPVEAGSVSDVLRSLADQFEGGGPAGTEVVGVRVLEEPREPGGAD